MSDNVGFSIIGDTWKSNNTFSTTLQAAADCFFSGFDIDIKLVGGIAASCISSVTYFSSVTRNKTSIYTHTDSWSEEDSGTKNINVGLSQHLEPFDTITIQMECRYCGPRIKTDLTDMSNVTKFFGISERVLQGTYSATAEQEMYIDVNNNGYPWTWMPSDESVFELFTPKPLNSWKIDVNNNGYPWTWGHEETYTNIF